MAKPTMMTTEMVGIHDWLVESEEPATVESVEFYEAILRFVQVNRERVANRNNWVFSYRTAPTFSLAQLATPSLISYSWPSPIDQIDAQLEKRFRELADEWISETGFLSDPIKKVLHRSHLKIIGLGMPALPLILKEVEKMTAHWFVALDAISLENPVRAEDQTSLQRTAEAWLNWGRAKGLI